MSTLKRYAAVIIAATLVGLLVVGLGVAILGNANEGWAWAKGDVVGHDLLVFPTDLDVFPVPANSRIGETTDTMKVTGAYYEILRPGSKNWEKIDGLATFSDGLPWWDPIFREQSFRKTSSSMPLSDSQIVVRSDGSLAHLHELKPYPYGDVDKDVLVLQVNGLWDDGSNFRLVLEGINKEGKKVSREINLWPRYSWLQLGLDRS